jgi:hypothetical protein
MLRHRLSISLVMDLSSPMNQVRRSTNSRRRRWFWVVQRPTSFGFSLYIRCRMYNWPWGLIARFRGRHEHTIHVAPEDPGVETTPPTPSTTWPQSIMFVERARHVAWDKPSAHTFIGGKRGIKQATNRQSARLPRAGFVLCHTSCGVLPSTLRDGGWGVWAIS